MFLFDSDITRWLIRAGWGEREEHRAGTEFGKYFEIMNEAEASRRQSHPYESGTMNEPKYSRSLVAP